MDAASGSRCMRVNRRMLAANLSTVAERTMKYSVHDLAILVDGQPVARIEVLPGELNDAKVTDLVAAANRGTGRQGPAPGPGPAPTAAQAIPGLVNDIDRKSTRLNSSHLVISYAVFCLKKKKKP